MPRETDTPDRIGDDTSDRSTDRRDLLSVNAIPIGIIVAFTVVAVLFPPDGVGESVLLFHGALIGGVVLVSAIAGWTITLLGTPLEGSVARSYGTESERE